MSRPRISISDYNYALPEEKIAQQALNERDESKLLVYRHGEIRENVFKNLTDELPPNAHLVFNNTKVIYARLHFYKSTGAKIEIFCLSPSENKEMQSALSEKGETTWTCIIGNAKKWKDEVLTIQAEIENKNISLNAQLKESKSGNAGVRFSWEGNYNFAEILHHFGKVPLPPYMKRDAEIGDKNRYQTVYAKIDGSVAAPTAGLHFTEKVFGNLKAKGIVKSEVTLHVGAGTFLPVKSDEIKNHEMHAEHIIVESDFLEGLLNAHECIIPVGTTSMRTIESLYWLAEMKNRNRDIDLQNFHISQWIPYETAGVFNRKQALEFLLQCMKSEKQKSLKGQTQIIIAPSYKMRFTDGIITNFHQPKSTLLLLIAALIGEDWKKAYDFALQNEFRFLSYGDSSLLWALNQKTTFY